MKSSLREKARHVWRAPNDWPQTLYMAALGLCYVIFFYRYLPGVTGLVDQFNAPVGRDFLHFWGAARLAIEGDYAGIYDPVRFSAALKTLSGEDWYGVNFWPYPPGTLLFTIPLMQDNYWLSMGLFHAFGFASLSFVFVRAFPDTDPTRLLLFLLLAPSTATILFYGHPGFLIAALLIGGMAFHDRRPVLAGILLGLATIKPQLGILVPVALIATRSWQTILVAVATAVCLNLLSLVIFGPDIWTTYFTHVPPLMANLYERGGGLALYMMTSVFVTITRVLDQSTLTGILVQTAFTLLAVVATYRLYRSDAPMILKISFWAAATLVATPYAQITDLTLLTFAVVGLYCATPPAQQSAALRMLFALTLVVPVLALFMNVLERPVGPLVIVVFAAVTWAEIRRVSGTRMETGPPSLSG